MVHTFWKKIPKDYKERAEKVGLTLHKAVIVASLIELETPLNDEKPLVAEVILNRLRKGVPLAIDASIIYGLGDDFKGDLKWRHLRDKRNPYNTRVYKGLPPGPICSPSLSSLLAAVSPSNKGYLYYVLDPEKGRHHFSKTLKEHNKYVRKLLKYRK
ncbi:MAG: endolytic transglycosylase MltG [Candidatus Dadabacteria bacterium]|nr:MAG: endolytic transglycosylase MltG [Candidatus Dadabacteria bacterium]